MTKKPIKTKEYERIMQYLKNDTSTRQETKDKYRKIFTFLYYTGARINEVCTLKGIQIKEIIQTKKTKILTTKTARFKGQEFRTVFFSDKAANEIHQAFKDSLNHLDAYCIRAWNNKNKMVNKISLANQINRYIQKALGSKDYGTHSFRRGLITEMVIDKQVQPEIVQNFIGHRNYATTAQYIKPTEHDLIQNLIR